MLSNTIRYPLFRLKLFSEGRKPLIIKEKVIYASENVDNEGYYEVFFKVDDKEFGVRSKQRRCAIERVQNTANFVETFGVPVTWFLFENGRKILEKIHAKQLEESGYPIKIEDFMGRLNQSNWR